MVMTRIFSLSIVAAVGLLLTGCYKMEETVANIYVVRLEGDEQVPVSEAEVRLFAEGGGEPRFDTTQTTTDEGFTSFNFSDLYVAGQSGFAVLSIECEKGNLSGTGLIKVEEMVTNEATVVME